MGNFFISYNKADRAWAEWIAWQLEEAGYTAFLQDWDFRPSDNFVIKMDNAIRHSERTIAVLSPDYLSEDASFSLLEWTAAIANDPTGDKGGLLPVRVRECELKGLLKQIIHVDLVGKDKAEARKALLAGIERGRAKPLTKPEFPTGIPRSVLEQPSFPGAGAKSARLKSLIALAVLLASLSAIAWGVALWPRLKSPDGSGQVNAGVASQPTVPPPPQPTTTPAPVRTATATPTPASSASPPASGNANAAASPGSGETGAGKTQSAESVGPTELEMKDALLRPMENRGGQRKPGDIIVFEHPLLGGLIIKVERFEKLGCKTATYGVGYECTYLITMSQTYYSTDGTEGGAKHADAFNQLTRWLGANVANGTLTKKFVRSSEGWVVFEN